MKLRRRPVKTIRWMKTISTHDTLQKGPRTPPVARNRLRRCSLVIGLTLSVLATPVLSHAARREALVAALMLRRDSVFRFVIARALLIQRAVVIRLSCTHWKDFRHSTVAQFCVSCRYEEQRINS